MWHRNNEKVIKSVSWLIRGFNTRNNYKITCLRENRSCKYSNLNQLKATMCLLWIGDKLFRAKVFCIKKIREKHLNLHKDSSECKLCENKKTTRGFCINTVTFGCWKRKISIKRETSCQVLSQRGRKHLTGKQHRFHREHRGVSLSHLINERTSTSQLSKHRSRKKVLTITYQHSSMAVSKHLN